MVTPEEATKALADMLMTVNGMQKIKGQAALSKKIRGCMSFLKRYKTNGSNIPGLMVNECNTELEKLNKLIGEHRERLKSMRK